MRDQTVYHMSQLSPAMCRRSIFLASELAAGVGAFGLARLTTDHASAVILSLIFTLGFAIFYAAMALVRNGVDDPAITFSIVTRISLVPSFEVAYAIAASPPLVLYALMHVGFVFWIALALVEGLVTREESRVAAKASSTLLTLQLLLFAVVLSLDIPAITIATVIGALFVNVAMRLRLERQDQIQPVAALHVERADQRGVQ